MERNFSNRDFERYVQEFADQYRMYPSEKVWKGIHNSLHKRRRWYGFGLAFLLLLTGGAVTFVMRSYPAAKKQAFNNSKPTNAITSVTPTIQSATQLTMAEETTNLKEILRFDQSKAANDGSGASSLYIASNNINSSQQNSTAEDAGVSTGDFSTEIGNDPIRLTTPVLTVVSRKPTVVSEKPSTALTETPEVTNGDDNIFDVPATDNHTTVNKRSIADANISLAPLNFSLENITNSYKPGPARITWQLFVTPTVSYRRLSENKSFSGSVTPALPYPFRQLKDVNNAVTHKPDLGVQLGVMARYPLTRAVNLRAGLQFNINRYDIKAFAYPAEVAVINLDDPGSTTVATWTRYRSQSGYRSDWLKNYYFSVSVPVGAEVILLGNRKKTNVGIAGTVQPTYILSDRAYLISTDYKNYAKVPWLIRHVNVSTGFEAFVNYGTGKTRWQVGPQVRYQWLSSFQNKYPVKENLFDFGLKIGMSINP